MTGAGAILLVLMIAAFALGVGGLYLILARRDRKRGALMLAAAAVTLANVAILTL
ncbi:MAG TPA: hypothetical protein VF704_07175 [Allosphingosinicella sp.]